MASSSHDQAAIRSDVSASADIRSRAGWHGHGWPHAAQSHDGRSGWCGFIGVSGRESGQGRRRGPKLSRPVTRRLHHVTLQLCTPCV